MYAVNWVKLPTSFDRLFFQEPYIHNWTVSSSEWYRPMQCETVHAGCQQHWWVKTENVIGPELSQLFIPHSAIEWQECIIMSMDFEMDFIFVFIEILKLSKMSLLLSLYWMYAMYITAIYAKFTSLPCSNETFIASR